MINSIIDGISITLNSIFGDDYEIYTDNVEQGLKEPCFFVFCINPTSNQFMAERYFRKNMFCIQYFPSTQDKTAECNEVTEMLFDYLECIDLKGDLIRGTKAHAEIVDGVLNFFINYDLFIYKSKKEPINEMGVLQQIEIDLKGDYDKYDKK